MVRVKILHSFISMKKHVMINIFFDIFFYKFHFHDSKRYFLGGKSKKLKGKKSKDA